MKVSRFLNLSIIYVLNYFKYFGTRCFENWTREILNLLGLHVVNCFKYSQLCILGQMSQKNQAKKILNYVKITRYSERFPKYIKWQNISIISNYIN